MLCVYSTFSSNVASSFSAISVAFSAGHSTVKCILHLSPAFIIGWSAVITSNPFISICSLPSNSVAVTFNTFAGIVPTFTMSTSYSTPAPWIT